MARPFVALSLGLAGAGLAALIAFALWATAIGFAQLVRMFE